MNKRALFELLDRPTSATRDVGRVKSRYLPEGTALGHQRDEHHAVASEG